MFGQVDKIRQISADFCLHIYHIFVTELCDLLTLNSDHSVPKSCYKDTAEIDCRFGV